MTYFLHAVPFSSDDLRQDRESQPVCKKCKTKHVVVIDEGISCCPLDDIRFLRRFYTKKINIAVTNIILGKHELELHVDPELFFFEKTFPLQVFERIPFPMVCKLLDKKDVYDLYERLLVYSSIIKINSLANLISLSIILDHLKLFLSYPKPVQTQLLSLRNKTVLENLKRDSTKSKGTHFLELFLTIMNRCWVHNKELNLTIGVFDWTNMLEHKTFPDKPFMKIKGKKLQVPFPFKEDSNMEYIHPYKRCVASDSHDRGVITNSEKCLRWIDSHWISHPIPDELLRQVKNGELADTFGEMPLKKGSRSNEIMNSVTSLTQAQTNQLIRIMYTAQCERIANGKLEEYYSTFMSNKFIEPIEPSETSVPTFEFTTASIPATAEQPAFNPTFAYMNSAQPVEEGERVMQDEVSGTYLVEAFQNFQNQMATSNTRTSATPEREASSGDPTVFIPYPLPPMMRSNKQPYDESSTDEEKKKDYLEFIEKNYGTNARDVVFQQLLAVGKSQNQSTAEDSNETTAVEPKCEVSDDESSDGFSSMDDEQKQDCLRQLSSPTNSRRDLSFYVARRRKVVRRATVRKSTKHENDEELGIGDAIKAYFQTNTESYYRSRGTSYKAECLSPSDDGDVEVVEFEEYAQETPEEAADSWFKAIVADRNERRDKTVPMTKEAKRKEVKELRFLKRYTYDVQRQRKLFGHLSFPILRNSTLYSRNEHGFYKYEGNGGSHNNSRSNAEFSALNDPVWGHVPRSNEVSESLEREKNYSENRDRLATGFTFPPNPKTNHQKKSPSSEYYPPLETAFYFPLNPATSTPRDYQRCFGTSQYDRYMRDKRNSESVRMLLEQRCSPRIVDRPLDRESGSIVNKPIKTEAQAGDKLSEDQSSFTSNYTDEQALIADLSKVKLEDTVEEADNIVASRSLPDLDEICNQAQGEIINQDEIENLDENIDNPKESPCSRNQGSSLEMPLSPLPGSVASEQTSVMASSACGDSAPTFKPIPVQSGTIKSRTALSTKFARNRLKATAMKRHITHNNTSGANRQAQDGQLNCSDVNADVQSKSTGELTTPIPATKLLANKPTADIEFSAEQASALQLTTNELGPKSIDQILIETLPRVFGCTGNRDFMANYPRLPDGKPILKKLLPFRSKLNASFIKSNVEKTNSQNVEPSAQKAPFVFGSASVNPTTVKQPNAVDTKASSDELRPFLFEFSTKDRTAVDSDAPVNTQNGKPLPFEFGLSVDDNDAPNKESPSQNEERLTDKPLPFGLFGESSIQVAPDSKSASEKLNVFGTTAQQNSAWNQKPLYVETSTEKPASCFSNAWSSFQQAANMHSNFSQFAYPYGLLATQQSASAFNQPTNSFGLLAPQQASVATANPLLFPFGQHNSHQAPLMTPNYMFPFGINPFQQQTAMNQASLFPFGNLGFHPNQIMHPNSVNIPADKQNQYPFGLLAPQQQGLNQQTNPVKVDGISPYSIPPFYYGSQAHLQALAAMNHNPLNAAASPFNRTPFFNGSPFQNPSFKPCSQHAGYSANMSLLSAMLNNAALNLTSSLSSRNMEGTANKDELEQEKMSAEKQNQKSTLKRKFPFKRPKPVEFSEMTKALLSMSEKEFVEMIKNKRISVEETIEAIQTGVPEVKRAVMTGSQDSDCYEEWKKTNEDFIARFKFNALYLLDQLEMNE